MINCWHNCGSFLLATYWTHVLSPPLFISAVCLGMKAKMASYLFVFLLLCVDVCVVTTFGASRILPPFISHCFTTLWVGGLLRFIILLLVTFLYPSSPAWMRSANGVQTVAVHSLIYPVYVTLLWAYGWSAVELTWGWHTWQGVSEGYSFVPEKWSKTARCHEMDLESALDLPLVVLWPHISVLFLLCQSNLTTITNVTYWNNDVLYFLSHNSCVMLWKVVESQKA